MPPILGEVTGILGGYLFGQWVGLFYSTIGLTAGSVAAFGIGRWLGARCVQKLVSPDIWQKMGFIVEAEGTILCFIIFLIPGLPPVDAKQQRELGIRVVEGLGPT